MTPTQIKMARHALGLPNDRKTSYRNHYYAPKGSEHETAWDDLVSRGLAKVSGVNRSSVAFCLTEAGAKRAIDPTENLDREDFPSISALSDKQRTGDHP